MKVALVSNWHQQCGNAAYARDLLPELQKEFEVLTFTDPWVVDGVQAAIVNWHPSRVQLPPTAVQQMKARGMKVIVILQNSFVGYYDSGAQDPLRFADAVVAHQHMSGNVEIKMIPHGVPVVNELREISKELLIGIAGFPYAWKRFDLVAKVARSLGGRALMIAPTHDMGDVQTEIRNIQAGFPETIVVRDWLPVEEVVRQLSTCWFNICWYEHKPPDDLVGQSGSVRMAIASRRPLIVSTHPKLMTLYNYDDELYVVPTEPEVYTTAKEIAVSLLAGKNGYYQDGLKVPRRIIDEMSWNTTGKMYRDLVKSLVGANVSN